MSNTQTIIYNNNIRSDNQVWSFNMNNNNNNKSSSSNNIMNNLNNYPYSPPFNPSNNGISNNIVPNNNSNSNLRFISPINNTFDNSNKSGNNSPTVDTRYRSLPSPLLSTKDSNNYSINNNILQGYDNKPYIPTILSNSSSGSNGTAAPAPAPVNINKLPFSLPPTAISSSQNLQVNNPLNNHIGMARPLITKPTINSQNIVNQNGSHMPYQNGYNELPHLRRTIPEIMNQHQAFNNSNASIIVTSNSAQYSMQAQKFHTQIMNSNTRKNTQETIAKSIAEKYKDKPISEYVPIVRNSEMEFLKLNSKTHSKSTIQIAEQMRKKERQVYAFIWLMQNCVSDETSFVPRGRIFSQYASSCVHNSLKPLSQASLGKLIRSVFPNLKTRRLGMRGQSKYHYCGLKLANDTQTQNEILSDEDSVISTDKKSNIIISGASENLPGSPINGSEDPNNESKLQYLSPNTKSDMDGSFSNDNSSLENDDIFSPSSNNSSNSPSRYCKDKQPTITNNDEILIYLYSGNDLPFVNGNLYDVIFNDDEVKSSNFNLKYPQIPLELLKDDMDRDIVSSLESMYYAHCNTLYQNIRYLKFDEIENSLSIFSSGSISPQMYNLFISNKLSDWVAECDMIVHSYLVKFLSSMLVNHFIDQQDGTLSELSLKNLEQFADSYSNMLEKSIIDLPRTTANKKLNIAKMFSRLLKKLISLLRIIKTFSTTIVTIKEMDEDTLSVIDFDNVMDILDSDVTPDRRIEIRNFVITEMQAFINDINSDNNETSNADKGEMIFSRIAKSLCDLFSKLENTPVIKIMCNAVRITDSLMTELSIKPVDNLLPWFLYNTLSHHLFFI
ncbi:hypothetical protein TPHA_0B03750 [Tetrapisispora phaffii CBS 4417]|uniref:RFX-type winged-helix domain-containing protein n=1 Tax=Tetrapisispora phaffii (strain ATCC 24235 / CBS 4417 / NBRC 1672 / NRRL Y-8282 / UCD 70-5) TaxID=1071381 RepID=G8BPW6_TETPH|nr:hypothetical protein TPHA_0B03750 [Tetrapisispora phaffii CBS 4417]CCE62047.1 hypothetical protein TPHA_0B03750 [Tetrapisispora phaffii CBS 4417]